MGLPHREKRASSRSGVMGLPHLRSSAQSGRVTLAEGLMCVAGGRGVGGGRGGGWWVGELARWGKGKGSDHLNHSLVF